jgi:hypothetical protein
MRNLLKLIGLIALVAVIGFSMIACDTGGWAFGSRTAPPTTPTTPEDDVWTHNLGTPALGLVDNWQYGEGYQLVYTVPGLFTGNQVTAGDEYILKITFTASRNFTDLLYVGLVDPSPEANYWKKLTAEDEDDGELIEGAAADKIITAGEVVTATINMTAIATSTGAAAAKNALVFQTKSTDGTPGTANSGTLGTITLTFTEFLFAKGELDDGTEPPPPPPPPPPPGEGVELPILFDGTDWAAEVGDVTVTGGSNTVIVLENAIDLTGYTKLVVEGIDPGGWIGGQLGNMGSNIQVGFWGGLTVESASKVSFDLSTVTTITEVDEIVISGDHTDGSDNLTASSLYLE